MSNQEGKKRAGGKAGDAYSRLEDAVDAALDRMAGLQADLDAARGQIKEMEELLRKFSEGEENPVHLTARLKEVEEMNETLMEKLQKGKEGVERLLARIRFLEEQG